MKVFLYILTSIYSLTSFAENFHFRELSQQEETILNKKYLTHNRELNIPSKNNPQLELLLLEKCGEEPYTHISPSQLGSDAEYCRWGSKEYAPHKCNSFLQVSDYNSYKKEKRVIDYHECKRKHSWLL